MIKRGISCGVVLICLCAIMISTGSATFNDSYKNNKVEIVEVESVPYVEERVATFSDVPKESEYFDAVEYLVKEGIVKGCGNGKFNPNDTITLNHFAIMLVRAYDEGKHEATPLPFIFSKGWIDMFTVSQSPDSEISRGSVYQIMLNMEKVSVFTDVPKRLGWEDYAKVIDNLYIIKKNDDLGNGITRGDVAKLFYYFLTRDVVAENPELFKDLKLENTTTQNIGDYYAYLQQIPEDILNEFKKLGWTLKIDEKAFVDYLDKTGVVAIGLCNYTEQTIYVKVPASLVHEFGHFVDYISDYNIGLDDLYELEGSAFETYRNTTLDNSREYFATFFDSYISYKSNSEKLNALKEVAPKTYEYMSNLESNGWKTLYKSNVTW